MSSKLERLAVVIETGKKRTFASAADWPGWSRSGRTDEAALEALLAYAPRYAPVAVASERQFPDSFEIEVVERVRGGSGTDFGVPSSIHAVDRLPTTGKEGARLARLVQTSWAAFDDTAQTAPAELRKGPRGGGRDRDKMVGHVVGADAAYAREIGVKVREPDPFDHEGVEAMRVQVLAVIRMASDGSPLAGRRWTARYAARRIAWHALDHAWEMEDRSE